MDKIRVLLADDHTVLREGMGDLLREDKNLEIVGEAGDGEEAVRLAAELKPDIILMDIVMPKLSGVEATKQIKQASPRTAVLILTAYDDISYIVGLLRVGACGYLLKSASRDEIIRAIHSVQSGDSVLDPAVTQKLLECASGPEASPDGRHEISQREGEILQLVARGMSNVEIAQTLCLNVRTVKAHLTNIFNKMGVSSRTEAILKGLREGYISLEEAPVEAEKRGDESKV